VASVWKVLGQQAPAAASLTALYTVPGATATVVSSIVVCNRDSADATFRVSVAVAGAADAVAQYLYFDAAVPANRTFIATIGVTLGAADVVRGYSSSGLLSFQVFGQEIS
jgi:hypothetical protein